MRADIGSRWADRCRRRHVQTSPLSSRCNDGEHLCVSLSFSPSSCFVLMRNVTDDAVTVLEVQTLISNTARRVTPVTK